MWGGDKGGSLSHKGHWTKGGTTSHCISLSHPHLDDCQKLQLHDPTRLRTRLFTPQGPFSQAVLDIFTSRFTSAENFNFTRGLCLHKDYVAGREFMAWKGGCCSGWGSPAAYASDSLGPALPFPLGLGCGLLLPRGLWGKDWDVRWEAGPGAGVGDSVAIRSRGGEISTERSWRSQGEEKSELLSLLQLRTLTPSPTSSLPCGTACAWWMGALPSTLRSH